MDPLPSTIPQNLDAAVPVFRDFVHAGTGQRHVIVHDTDADGLSAGVLLELALRRLGHPNVTRFLPYKSRNVWSPEARARLLGMSPQRLYVLDLGVRAEPLLPGTPTCFIDHHALDDLPAEALILSSYGWRPSPNTSLLTWQLCGALTGMADRDWLAAVGTIGDLGDEIAFPYLTAVKHTYGLAVIREIVSLVNAGRRVSPELAEVAGAMLARHPLPESILASPEIAPLQQAQRDLQRAMADAKRAAPVFSREVALVRVASPYQIHPIVAQIWKSRLKKYIVIAANEAYLPGLVNFSVRGPTGVNVREFLRGVPLEPGEGEYARGHDAASGGSLPIERWNRLLNLLGFPETVYVRSEA
jgi:single-stranded DNA-specific DHH superfamily exonuclease